MSQINNILTACPTLQQKLNEAWAVGRGLAADERMPFAEFLLSPENRRNVSFEVSPGAGKVRTYQVKYWQRLLESSLLSNQSNPNCTTGETPEDNQTTYTLDTGVNLQTAGVTLTSTDLEAVCDPNSTLFAELMLREMDVLRRGVATRITTQGVALFGTWGDGIFTTGNAVGNVNSNVEFVMATKLSGGAPDPDGWIKLRNALEDIGYGNQVAVFGGGALREFYQRMQAGCCTDWGLDIGALFAQYGYAYAYDKRVKSALSSDSKGITMLPGALQVLQHTRAPWREGMPAEVMAGADYVHMVVADPALGAVYDMSLKDDCGSVSFNLTWTGKTVGMPTDMFSASDELNGVTYVNKVLVTNP